MLLDVALVTSTLLSLISNGINASPYKTKVTPLTVSPLPPDLLAGDRAIGLFLYHITENPAFKNLPPPSPDQPPIRYTPMGLILHYQLSAHSDLGADTGALMEQTLIGLAVKALRDYPILDDSTQIGANQIMVPDLRGGHNHFRIVLQPVPYNEAMTYWTAGSKPLRLALYYQVSVVLLEPEEPQLHTGRALTYGLFSFVRGAPHLDGSSSNVEFTMPGAVSPQVVEAQPAEAPTGGTITFFGSELAADQTTLIIASSQFGGGVEVGADWGVIATASEIYSTVGTRLSGASVVPNTYTAVAKVVERRKMPDGTLRDFIKTSNATPFTVTPLITSIGAPDVNQIVLVQGGVFQDAQGIAADAVSVFVGATRITPKAGATLNPGEFEIVDASNIYFRYPVAGVNSGATASFRIIINGAETAPNWVVAP